jgi:hypothetical protein
MTIEEIRESHATLTTEQLEAEKHERDLQVVAIQRERAELKALLDPRWAAAHREACAAAPAKLNQKLLTGGRD